MACNYSQFSCFQVDKMLAEDIAKLMTLIPNEEMKARQEGTDRIEGGAFEAVLTKDTPFMYKGGEFNFKKIAWICSKQLLLQ